jgi:hypothetical protein
MIKVRKKYKDRICESYLIYKNVYKKFIIKIID